MKNVIVLGCGRGQIPIMNLCHKYGWNVIGVSPEGEYPGFIISDVNVIANVRDFCDVLEKVKQYNIDAVVTDQLDVGVLSAAKIAEHFGIKGIGSEVALLFTNKYEMRKKAKEIGVNVPHSICVGSIDQALDIAENDPELHYPLMIKPVDSDASRGVYKVYNKEELLSKFANSQQFSQCGNVVIENYIIGKEYVVEAYTTHNRTTNLVVGHRDYFNIKDTFIPCATVFVDAVSANSELETRLKEMNKIIVEGFGLPFGITHGEYLYNETEDKIYLVEIAARGGGVFISSDLIPNACGVNANDLLVREALQINDISEKELKLYRGASAYFCYMTPEGVVTEIEGIDEVNHINGVTKAFFDNIHIGMQTDSITNKSSRKGPILVKGKTKEECYKTIQEVRNKLRIVVKTDNHTESIIWN